MLRHWNLKFLEGSKLASGILLHRFSHDKVRNFFIIICQYSIFSSVNVCRSAVFNGLLDNIKRFLFEPNFLLFFLFFFESWLKLKMTLFWLSLRTNIWSIVFAWMNWSFRTKSCRVVILISWRLSRRQKNYVYISS